MKTRELAISFFDAVGTAIGGITGPLLFGKLIESGETAVLRGYFLGAAVMIVGGIVEWVLDDGDGAGGDGLDLDRFRGEQDARV